MSFLVPFCRGVYLVAKVVVKIYGLVYEICNLISVFAGIDCKEKRAVIYESANYILDVFFNVFYSIVFF